MKQTILMGYFQRKCAGARPNTPIRTQIPKVGIGTEYGWVYSNGFTGSFGLWASIHSGISEFPSRSLGTSVTHADMFVRLK